MVGNQSKGKLAAAAAIELESPPRNETADAQVNTTQMHTMPDMHSRVDTMGGVRGAVDLCRRGHSLRGSYRFWRWDVVVVVLVPVFGVWCWM